MPRRLTKVLVTGAAGQIGSELTPALRKRYGRDNVVVIIHRTEPTGPVRDGQDEPVDFTRRESLRGP
jgi:nucleoside-diphosphate-sugar epimerase